MTGDKAKFRVLMFAPRFMPICNPEAIVNAKLALAMLEAGWELDVISRGFVGRCYEYGTQWCEPWLPLQAHTHEIPYDMRRSWRDALTTAGSILRLGHPISGCRVSAREADLGLRLHRQRPYGVILSRASPDVGHLAPMKVARETRLPWIANWNDPPSGQMPPPYGRGPSGGAGFFHRRFLSRVAREASWHTFPCDRLARYIRACIPGGQIMEAKSTTIPHVSLGGYQPPSHVKGPAFVLGHAGLLGGHRHPGTLLQAIAELRRQKGLQDRLRLRIVGREGPELAGLARELGIESCIELAGDMDYVHSLDAIARCDLAVAVDAPCEEGVFLPSKFVDYIRTGRPILAVTPRAGTLSDIVSAHGGGIAADCRSYESVRSALETLYACWEDGTLEDRYGSVRLQRLVSPGIVLGQYETIFRRLGVRGPGG